MFPHRIIETIEMYLLKKILNDDSQYKQLNTRDTQHQIPVHNDASENE